MRMKRLMALLMMLALLAAAVPAMADDVLTVTDVDGTNHPSDQPYLRITCPVADDSNVTVTVAEEGGGVTYQRDYGVCSGTFRSEDIYLRLNGEETVYNITVTAGAETHAFQVTRTMPYLRENAACSVGYPLSELSGSGGWKSVTMLDLATLEGSVMTVPMHASGAYTLGSVTFTVESGMLTVSAKLADGMDGTIDRGMVYVATNPIDAQNLGARHFDGLAGRLEEAIDLQGADYAAVYVKLTVSFDPAGVPSSPETVLDGQAELWQMMQQMQLSDAVG